MNERSASLRFRLVMVSLGAVLAAGACSRKEEPAPATGPVATATPPAPPTGASGEDWSWATTPAGGTAPAAAPLPASEEPAPTRIEPSPPRPSKPRPAEPTNKLERPQPEAERPAPAPEPVKVTYTASAGTSATFRLDREISSETAKVGDGVSGTLAADVTDGQGHVVLPAGTKLSGTVTEAVSAKKVKKKSSLAFSMTEAELPDGTRVAVAVGDRTEGKGWTKKQGAIIGGSAAGGAILGQILGGDTKSAAAGAVIGGAISSGVVMSKKGEDVVIAAGQDITLPFETPVHVERTESASTVRTSG